MSIPVLQQAIREKKTPLALGLCPDYAKVSEPIKKNFTEMFGPGAMAETESLRYHGTQALSAAQGKLPAVFISAAAYLPYGMMGMDVLWNLVSAAKSMGYYVILDCGGDARPWLPIGADGYTVGPYLGGDVCALGEGKAAFAQVRTAGSGSDVQTLRAGDRPLYAAAAEQMVRRGAALAIDTGYSLDIKELRRRFDKTFLLLTHCDGENALPAFDDYGHGALVVDETIQYGADVDKAIRAMKQWVSVV